MRFWIFRVRFSLLYLYNLTNLLIFQHSLSIHFLNSIISVSHSQFLSIYLFHFLSWSLYISLFITPKVPTHWSLTLGQPDNFVIIKRGRKIQKLSKGCTLDQFAGTISHDSAWSLHLPWRSEVHYQSPATMIRNNQKTTK